MQKWQTRWSPTLGSLEEGHQEVWGTNDYENIDDPTVFFGIYGLPDFYTLWRHKGRKAILWCGTDIIHFCNGYWLDTSGKIKLESKGMDGGIAAWIDTYCENYVENEVEQNALAKMGIRSKVRPSFLGDVNKFEISYKHSHRPKVYTSVSGDNFEQYGWNKIPILASENPDIEFHLYGNSKEWLPPLDKWHFANVVVHGRVPKEQMNEEIKHMQGALRLTTFDGFSEILAKSVLMGQWPVSLIEYPHMLRLEDLEKLKFRQQPNLEGREYYINKLNDYPWNIYRKPVNPPTSPMV
jgi:hypothetical protein